MNDEWDRFPTQPAKRYPLDWNRILSGVLAVGLLAWSAINAGVAGILSAILQIALPLACIWFPDELGALTTKWPGPLSSAAITAPSAPSLVRVFGWIALLALTILRVSVVITTLQRGTTIS